MATSKALEVLELIDSGKVGTVWFGQEMTYGYLVGIGSQGLKFLRDKWGQGYGKLLDGKATYEQAIAVYRLTREAMMQGCYGVGVWESDGIIFIDMVVWVPTYWRAIRLGQVEGELSIWNIPKAQAIYVGKYTDVSHVRV